MATLTITMLGVENSMPVNVVAGMPPAASNLQPVLDAIAALPVPAEVDLSPVLDALASVQATVSAIPAPAPTDLSPVLDALAALPDPDISAAVAPLSQAVDVANGFATVLDALASLPVPESVDLSPVMTALASVQAAVIAKLDALPAPNVDLTPVLDALAAQSGAGAEPGQVLTFSLNASGQVPAGYALMNGIGELPVLGGLLAYIGNGKNLTNIGAAVNSASSSPVLRGATGEAIYANGTQLFSWSNANGYGVNPLPVHPGSGSCILSTTFIPSGRLLTAGSVLGSYGSAACYAGNFGSATWNQVASLAVARGHAGLSTLADGRAVCIGGCTNYSASAGALVAATETYSEPTNTWTRNADAPVRGAGASATLPSGTNVIWVPTVLSADGVTMVTNTNRAFLYNSATGTQGSWVETDSLPAGVTLNSSTALVKDAAGALLLNLTGTHAACRYTEANAPGTRWTLLKLDCLAPYASAQRGGIAGMMAGGQVFVPASSGPPQVVSVMFNPGGQVVQARKL